MLLRKKTGLSQEQFAAKVQCEGLNLTQKTISRIETGDRVVPDYELIVFVKVLDTSIDFLLSGAEVNS
jgi:transcriptional regulator with XRE-family HTH domain